MKKGNIAILINGKYLQWCDNKWYETGTIPKYICATEAEIIELVLQLGKHYVYNVQTVTEDGKVENYDYFKIKYGVHEVPMRNVVVYDEWMNSIPMTL